ncbi:UvrD-helicase domain-containing protein [Acidithiobacillus sulfuriphilus]|uniref:UvrD-helicase domain-containing protein n=1 Tax=Acidithiobacillus sulfuriphilus TaxID=1867749 RepID=UPI003F63B21A
MFSLTDEQEQAVAMARQMRGFKVSALAGTGKTTTLAAIARALGQKRGLYLSFNKTIATEAQKKFSGTGCEARTFHSLAFAGFGRKYGFRLNKRLNAGYLRSRFGISGDYAYAISEVALGTLSRFLRTADPEIATDHVAWNDACKEVLSGRRALMSEYHACGDDAAKKSEINQKLAANEQECKVCYKIRDEAIIVARKVLEEMRNPNSDVPVTHDLYLREFVLSNPDLGSAGFRYDYILFDEAQDADSLMLLLTTSQSLPVFYVGDAYQQIYEWRGARNAMASLDLPETPLTMSFRFGQAIADDANAVLRSLDAKFLLRGRPDLRSTVITDKAVSGARATIVRTNAEVMAQALLGLGDGCRVGVSGKAGIRAFLRDYQKLVSGHPSGQFALFQTENDLRDHAQSGEGSDLKMLLHLVDDYGMDSLDSVMASTVDLDSDKDAWKSCDRIVITAHKSKGMEFDTVLLSDGLFNPKRLANDEEKRLLYVAKTRAINVLKQPVDYSRLDLSQGSADRSMEQAIDKIVGSA